MTVGDELGELLAGVRDDEPLPEDIMKRIEERVAADSSLEVPPAASTEPEGRGAAATDDVRQLVLKATLPQKIKFAMFGNSVARAFLIRDGNRMIQEFVLKNPRLQLSEIEEYSKNPNISQNVLRHIAAQQQWMRPYAVKANLVNNPKTPADLSLKWLRYLNTGDLKKLARSKNVAQVVAVMAKKRLNDIEKGH